MYLLLPLVLCQQKVKIAVYEESLCPDCDRFFVNSVKAAIYSPDFLTMADLQVMPFGNANFTQTSGSANFSCQHGPNQCFGNMVHLCSKKYSPSDLIAIQVSVCHFQVGFATKNFTYSIGTCSRKFNLDANRILTCATGEEGKTLLLQSGKATNALVPKHTYVPWITVNGSHNVTNENAVISSLLQFVCKTYTGPKTAACK